MSTTVTDFEGWLWSLSFRILFPSKVSCLTYLEYIYERCRLVMLLELPVEQELECN